MENSGPYRIYFHLRGLPYFSGLLEGQNFNNLHKRLYGPIILCHADILPMLPLKRTTSELRAEKIKVSIDRVNQQLKCSLDRERLDEEEKALSLIKENPKHFFNFANRKSKIKPRIGRLEKTDGSLTNTDSEVANNLNEQYRLAFSTPDTGNKVADPDDLFKESDNDSLVVRDVYFSVDCVKEVLRSFKAGSSPGPDGVPAILIKECNHEIAPSLFYGSSSFVRIHSDEIVRILFIADFVRPIT